MSIGSSKKALIMDEDDRANIPRRKLVLRDEQEHPNGEILTSYYYIFQKFMLEISNVKNEVINITSKAGVRYSAYLAAHDRELPQTFEETMNLVEKYVRQEVGKITFKCKMVSAAKKYSSEGMISRIHDKQAK
ncbi:hypothetical protein ACFE04_030380 [Oxalis oulophora]